jgi:hypothetical protein
MRTIGLQDLKLAFERAGLPCSPPEPDHLSGRDRDLSADHLSGRTPDHLSNQDRDIPPELLVDHPDPPRVQWRRSEPEPGVVTGVCWDYDPWSKERLR